MKNSNSLSILLAALIIFFSFSNSTAQKSALSSFDKSDTVDFQGGVFNTSLRDTNPAVISDAVVFCRSVLNTPERDTIRPVVSDSVETFKYTKLNLHTIGTGYRDAGRCTTSALRWKGNDWLKFVALGATGLALHQLDVPINKMAYRNDSRLMRDFGNAFDPVGNLFYILPAIGGTYLISHLAGNEELSGLAITAGKAVMIANTFVTYGKVLAHRHRPSEDIPSKPNQWDGPRLDLKNASFFSSHTTTAFALATVIASTYADHKWLPPVAYTMASLIGVSRIAAHDHWATDVFVGAVIGYSVGKLVYKLNRSKKIKLVVGL